MELWQALDAVYSDQTRNQVEKYLSSSQVESNETSLFLHFEANAVPMLRMLFQQKRCLKKMSATGADNSSPVYIIWDVESLDGLKSNTPNDDKAFAANVFRLAEEHGSSTKYIFMSSSLLRYFMQARNKLQVHLQARFLRFLQAQ
jgi:hypothetical protein